MQPVPLESAHQEVPVVHEQIPHARIGQVGGQIGLPHPLGEPQAGRLDAEAAPDRFTHPADLLESIRTHQRREQDRKSTRLNSSHSQISYAVFCLKKKKKKYKRSVFHLLKWFVPY